MRQFSQVDVFSAEGLSGNPVAVVHDADGVDDERMAEFARWTNLSETTVLLTPTDAGADYRLRIFTTDLELPFAGHPTLGSARAWLEAGGVPRRSGELVQQCGAGLVRLRQHGTRLAFAAPPVLRGGPVDPAELSSITAALGLGATDVVDAQWVDNGPGWVALLLRDAAAVLAVEVDGASLRGMSVGLVGPHPAGSDAAFELRGFIPGTGAGTGAAEDPVTGSLNASVAQWLIASGRAPDSYVATQGTRLGRRGRVHVDRVGDDVWVGGDTRLVIAGTVEV